MAEESAQLQKKAEYISSQLAALREAYEKMFPGESILICYHIAGDMNGDSKTATKSGFSHTPIHSLEFAKAIFDWACMLGDYEDEDSNTSWNEPA